MAAVYPKEEFSLGNVRKCKGATKSTDVDCTAIVCPIEEVK
jgi:hypothetical protein